MAPRQAVSVGPGSQTQDNLDFLGLCAPGYHPRLLACKLTNASLTRNCPADGCTATFGAKAS